MKNILSATVMTMFLFISVFALSVFATGTASPSDWAVSEVQTAIGAGFVQEELQTNYTVPITRKEFAELSVRFAIHELGYGTTEAFAEVLAGLKEPVMFADIDNVYVVLASQMGVVYGTGDGFFEPDRSITREEAATMLERLYDSYGNIRSRGEIAFEDNDLISDWAFNKVRWCVGVQVMKGVSETVFDPKGLYTREQSIATFARLDAMEGWKSDNVGAKIRRKITVEDAINEYLSNTNVTEIGRYHTNGYGTVLSVRQNISPALDRYYFVLIGNDGKSHSIGRMPVLNKMGQTPPVTKVELLEYNSVLYFEVRYEADMLGIFSEVSEPGTYWEKMNLITLEYEKGYIRDNVW